MREQPQHVRRERARVVGRRQQPRRAGLDQIGHAVDGGRHHRPGGGHRLGERAAKALVDRGDHEHVERRREPRGVVPVAGEHDLHAEALGLGARFVLHPFGLVAVADPHEPRVGPVATDEVGHTHEIQRRLLPHDAPDRSDQGRVFVDAELRPYGRVGGRRNQIELHAGRDDRHRSGGSDPHLDGLAGNPRRDRDEAVCEPPREPLHPHVGAPPAGRHLVMPREGVEGMDHDRDAGPSRGEPPEHARLGHVRVHDGEPLAAHQPDERAIRRDVVEQRDRLAEAGQLHRTNAQFLSLVPQLAARGREDPRVVPGAVHAGGRQQGVPAATAAKLRHDVQDLDPVRGGLRRKPLDRDDRRRRWRPLHRHVATSTRRRRSDANTYAAPSTPTNAHVWR
jgi:hypothetical protein